MKYAKMLLLCGACTLCAACAAAPTPAPSPIPPAPPPTAPVTARPTPAGVTPLSAVAPRADQAQWGEGAIFLEKATVVVLDGSPREAAVTLVGALPTPCNALRMALSAEAGNRLALRAYTVTDPNRMCAQVLSPLNVTVSLGSFPPGAYKVVLNGEEIGAFTL